MPKQVLVTTLALLTLVSILASLASTETPEGLSTTEWSSIRAAYEDGRHRVFEVDGGFESRSIAQQYVSRFDGRGVKIDQDGGEWSFGLALTSYGRGDDVVWVGSPIETSRTARRIEYRWDERLSEWYVNGDAGLEHGFTVTAPPNGSAELALVLAVRGGLRGQVDPGSRGVTFVDAQGREVVHDR